jgi:hypothetical protein
MLSCGAREGPDIMTSTQSSKQEVDFGTELVRMEAAAETVAPGVAAIVEAYARAAGPITGAWHALNDTPVTYATGAIPTAAR